MRGDLRSCGGDQRAFRNGPICISCKGFLTTRRLEEFKKRFQTNSSQLGVSRGRCIPKAQDFGRASSRAEQPEPEEQRGFCGLEIGLVGCLRVRGHRRRETKPSLAPYSNFCCFLECFGLFWDVEGGWKSWVGEILKEVFLLACFLKLWFHTNPQEINLSPTQ